MKKCGLSQESLKMIACATMLLDHIGATLVQWDILRLIGRLSFPIFCFLIVEGAHYTHNAKQYSMRLLIGTLLSELPFDLAFYGHWNWYSNSVMLTLLFGFWALQVMQSQWNEIFKCLAVIMLAVFGELLFTDYGSAGVLLIILFGVTRQLPCKRLIQILGMSILFFHMGGALITIGRWTIYMEMFALFSIVPISLYTGKKATHSRAFQWGFYLFYSVHLWLLYLLRLFLCS